MCKNFWLSTKRKFSIIEKNLFKEDFSSNLEGKEEVNLPLI